MQLLNCVSFLLGVTILLATLGPFVTIAHREMLMVTNSEKELETKLELTVDKTSTDEEIRNNVLTGRKMASGDSFMEKKDAKDARSKSSSGAKHSVGKCQHGGRKDLSMNCYFRSRKLPPGINFDGDIPFTADYGDVKICTTHSPVPSSLKDISSSSMKAGPSMDSIKLEGSTSELVLNVPNPQRIRILPSRRNSSSGSKKQMKDPIVRGTLYKINEDWKEKMREASDEVLKLLNKDYHNFPRRKPPVHN